MHLRHRPDALGLTLAPGGWVPPAPEPNAPPRPPDPPRPTAYPWDAGAPQPTTYLREPDAPPPTGYPREPDAPPSAGYRPEPGAPGTPPPWAPPPPKQRPPDAGRRTIRTHLGAALAILGPIVSFGMLTWLFVGYFAIRRRSWRLAAATAGYLTITVLALVAVGEENADWPLWRDLVFWFSLLLLIGGGAVHLAAIVYSRRTPPRRPEWPTH